MSMIQHAPQYVWIYQLALLLVGSIVFGISIWRAVDSSNAKARRLFLTIGMLLIAPAFVLTGFIINENSLLGELNAALAILFAATAMTILIL
ncbi:MAG: hypothetical protein WAX89_01505 [Alphaproteobacteria bacterium]